MLSCPATAAAPRSLPWEYPGIFPLPPRDFSPGSSTFPARRAIPREQHGMDRANFASQSPREDKPVKLRQQLS